ncbi:MAG: oligosaccharide flippase family protein [Methylococcales bacterium]
MHSEIIKNIWILCSGTFVQKIITFVALGYYARTFDASEIAIIPLYYLVTNLSHVVLGFGVQAYIMKTVPELLYSDPKKAKILINKILLIAYISGVIFGVVFFIVSKHYTVSSELDLLTVIGIVGFSIGAAFECMNATQREILTAAKKVKKLAVLLVVKTILLPLLIICLYDNLKADGIAVAMACVSVISCVITRFMLGSLVKNNICSNEITFLSIFSESWPYYIESGLMLLRRQGDQIVIVSFMGTEALGIYFVAQRLGEMMWSFVVQIDAVLTPELSKKAGESLQSLKEIFSVLVKVALYVITPIVIVCTCLVPMYIYLISGDRYGSASIPAAILCIKVLPEIIRVTIIGRVVLVSCSALSRLKLTLVDLVILIPFSVISAVNDQLPLVALAPIVSAIGSSIFGYYLLKSNFEAEFPVSRTVICIVNMAISLYAGNLVINNIESAIVGPIIASVVSMTIYIILFINSVDLKDYRLVINRILPSRINQFSDALLVLRIAGWSRMNG